MGAGPALMLTSLLDMFTIILIFLIVSFEAESFDFRLNPDLVLPESTASAQLKPAVNVSVTGESILVENEEVARLTDGRAQDAEYDANEIPALVAALRAEYERRFGDQPTVGARVDQQDEASEEQEPIVVLQSDRHLDYRTLYLVLRSAATAGFFKYRLAILKT
jgi:biopolymer transport protein ExbD